MQKEEFPTFLNEQPTIIFNRTGRELLLIAMGATLAFGTWTDLGNVIHGNIIVANLVKGLVVLIEMTIALVIAFVKIATRPLEEWAATWLFYVLIPKVYIYVPVEESVELDEQSYIDTMEKIVNSRNGEDDEGE
jgi:hypothetical protein